MPRGGTSGGTQLGVKYCETLTGSTLTVPSSKQRFPDIACALSFKLMFKGSPGQKQTSIKNPSYCVSNIDVMLAPCVHIKHKSYDIIFVHISGFPSGLEKENITFHLRCSLPQGRALRLVKKSETVRPTTPLYTKLSHEGFLRAS